VSTDLPAPPDTGRPTSPRPSGDAAPRFRRWQIVLVFVIALAIIAAAAAVLLLINEPDEPEAPCKPGVPCVLQRRADPVAHGKTWVSKDLGFSFQYPSEILRITSQDGTSVQLGARGTRAEVQIWISGARAGTSSVDELVKKRRDALAQRVLGLTEDANSADRVMAPGLGFVRGSGGAYTGTLDSASGPSSPANVVIMAAGNGRTNVVLSMLITGEDLNHDLVQAVRNGAGLVIVDTLRFT
jgi:hypothetical protein